MGPLLRISRLFIRGVMDLHDVLPLVEAYLEDADLSSVRGWHNNAPFAVSPLAQGEYNMNYLVRQGGAAWVFRVNMGTQINRDDQILYEFRTLKLLETTGVTPRPFYVDDSRQRMEYGLLIMEYLPGQPLDYRRDLAAAARLFARIHTQPVPSEQNHLIYEDRPLSMTFEECARLLPTYMESELADPALRDYLSEVLAWADEARYREVYFVQDPWSCTINTEVNSGNFVADRERGTLHLLDWEKALWGDPSQDLSHFCAPMTTLWKTDYRMTAEDKRHFLDAYREHICDAHWRDTVVDRVRLRDPFNYLRGISWSAMAWVKYQTGEHALRNPDTFIKVSQYLDLAFLRGMFEPYLRPGA